MEKTTLRFRLGEWFLSHLSWEISKELFKYLVLVVGLAWVTPQIKHARDWWSTHDEAKTKQEIVQASDGVKSESVHVSATLPDSSVEPEKQTTESADIFTYVVQPNDTLRALCSSLVGRYDETVQKEIRRLNPDLEDLKNLKAGQEIRIPLHPPKPLTFTYVVQPNDTIRALCMSLMGRYDEDAEAEVRSLNPELKSLLDLKPGQEIVLPLAPSRN